MPGLILNAGGTSRIFRPDGKVAVADAAGTETIKGEWSSAGRRDVNRIHYDFDGDDGEFDVLYEFNNVNQLVAKIPAASNGGATDSEPFIFPGRITVDDGRDVAYELMDGPGSFTGETIVVHGTLNFVEGLDQLKLELANGGVTQIRGSKSAGAKSPFSEPAKNASEDGGGDRIEFKAATLNTFGDNEVEEDAEILFKGKWDLDEHGLYFSTGLKDGEVRIQFGGTYKGVTAGLEYYAKNGDTHAAFTIHGEHQFKRPNGHDGEVNWLLTLGYSNAKIEAVAELNLKTEDKNGNKLTIGGNIRFVSTKKASDGKGIEQVKSAKFDMELAATYEMKDGQITFSADIHKDGEQTGYNLKLEGKYKIRNGNVNFLVKLGRKDNVNSIDVELGRTFESPTLSAHVDLMLKKTGTSKAEVGVNFDIRARWVDGKLMKNDKPVPVDPAAG